MEWHKALPFPKQLPSTIHWIIHSPPKSGIPSNYINVSLIIHLIFIERHLKYNISKKELLITHSRPWSQFSTQQPKWPLKLRCCHHTASGWRSHPRRAEVLMEMQDLIQPLPRSPSHHHSPHSAFYYPRFRPPRSDSPPIAKLLLLQAFALAGSLA